MKKVNKVVYKSGGDYRIKMRLKLTILFNILSNCIRQ